MKCIHNHCKTEAKPNSNYCVDHAEVMAGRRNCVDCRFRIYDSWSPGFDKCSEVGNYTSIERNPFYDSIHRCGSKGLLWQPKPPSIFKPWHYVMMALVVMTAIVTIGFS